MPKGFTLLTPPVWRIKKGSRKDRLDAFYVFEKDIIEEIKRIQYDDPGKMVYGIIFTKNRVLDFLDKKYIAEQLLGIPYSQQNVKLVIVIQ